LISIPFLHLKPHRHARQSEHGQALILIVFAIVGLVGITALAVDGGNVYSDRRHAQNAADAAALAAALSRINGEVWVNRAYQVAASNGYNNNGVTNSVVVVSPPTAGVYKGNIEYIQVTITSHVRTYFASVVGMQSLTNTVQAMARAKPSVLGPLFGGAAVVALAPTSDCWFHKAFEVNAELTLDIFGSGILINSNNPTCALWTQGEGSIRIETLQPIQIVGGAQIQKPKLITPYPPVTHWAPIPYPPPVFMPKVSCTGSSHQVSPDSQEMTPGNWGREPFPPTGINRLAPGTYCLGGDFILGPGQTLTGDEVVIVMESGQLRWTGGSLIKIGAPKSGKYHGLLIYQPMENQNTMILNAEIDSSIKGTILAPAAQIRIKGNASTYGFHSQIIGYTILADGQDNVIIKYNPDDNYQALTMPEVHFVK
jgi:Flp pilus assembly protein TadG